MERIQFKRIDQALDRLQSAFFAMENMDGWIHIGSLRRKLARVNNLPAARAWAIKARKVIGEL